MTCPCDIAQIAHNTWSMSSTSYELITFTNSYAVNNNTGSRSEASLIRPRPPFVRVLVTAASGKVTYLPGNVPILFMLTLVRILYYHHVILRTSPSSLYTCRVFISQLHATESTRNRGPGVQPGDLFTSSRNRHQYTRSSIRVRGYSEWL